MEKEKTSALRLKTMPIRYYILPTVLFVCSALLVCLGHQGWGGAFFVCGILTLPRYER